MRLPKQTRAYMFLNDPTNMFRRGCQFSLYDFETTLVAGTWPDGSLVRHKSGKMYVIKGDKKYFIGLYTDE